VIKQCLNEKTASLSVRETPLLQVITEYNVVLSCPSWDRTRTLLIQSPLANTKNYNDLPHFIGGPGIGAVDSFLQYHSSPEETDTETATLTWPNPPPTALTYQANMPRSQGGVRLGGRPSRARAASAG